MAARHTGGPCVCAQTILDHQRYATAGDSAPDRNSPEASAWHATRGAATRKRQQMALQAVREASRTSCGFRSTRMLMTRKPRSDLDVQIGTPGLPRPAFGLAEINT